MGILGRCFGISDSTHTSSSPNSSPSPLIEQLCQRFSLAQIKKATNNFDETQKIVGGVYVVAYKGQMNIAGKDCAVKIKRLTKASNQTISNQRRSHLKNEILLLSQLCHPNLVPFFGFCDEKDEMILVFEFMFKGHLSDHLSGRYVNIEPLSWVKRLEICIGVAHGLHYLHTGVKHTILHRHMEPSNILLDENLTPRIADFGFSLISTREAKPVEVKEIMGTSIYMAPEYAMYGKFTDKADVYSFGMILLRVVCAMKLNTVIGSIDGSTEDWIWDVNRNRVDEHKDDDERKRLQGSIFRNLAREVQDFVQNESADKVINPFLNGKIAPTCWELFIDIIKSCLLEEPNERPTIVEIEEELEHALELQKETGNHNCYLWW